MQPNKMKYGKKPWSVGLCVSNMLGFERKYLLLLQIFTYDFKLLCLSTSLQSQLLYRSVYPILAHLIILLTSQRLHNPSTSTRHPPKLRMSIAVLVAVPTCAVLPILSPRRSQKLTHGYSSSLTHPYQCNEYNGVCSGNLPAFSKSGNGQFWTKSVMLRLILRLPLMDLQVGAKFITPRVSVAWS